MYKFIIMLMFSVGNSQADVQKPVNKRLTQYRGQTAAFPPSKFIKKESFW